VQSSSPVNSVSSSRPAVLSAAAAEYWNPGLLEGLTKAEVHSILAEATLRQYPAHYVVAQQSDSADHFFLLRTGCARLFYLTQEGRNISLRWLLPGEILGLAAILPSPSPFLVSTETVHKSSAFVWQRNTIRRLTTQYPKLLDNALPYASDHLTWFLSAHLALVSRSARERLAHVLLSLAQGIGRKVPSGVRLDITNEHLANAANITLFTASRLLSQWQRSGALEKGRGTVTVCDPGRLL
jgi:CRP/FNR family transcriptional regulator, nitrogen oxide reductase regulator